MKILSATGSGKCKCDEDVLTPPGKYPWIAKEFFLYYIGMTTYITIEVMYRGYSHWSMGVVGGICFLLIGRINQRCRWDMSLILQMLLSTGIITLLELVSGLILNVWLGMGIWDYSNLRYNFMGQISLRYTMLWMLLSLAAIFLDDWLRHFLFGERKPRYRVF